MKSSPNPFKGVLRPPQGENVATEIDAKARAVENDLETMCSTGVHYATADKGSTISPDDSAAIRAYYNQGQLCLHCYDVWRKSQQL